MAAGGWELFAMGMGDPYAPNLAAATAYMYGLPSTDTLRIDDLLDFSSSSSATGNADAHLLHTTASDPSSALTPAITTTTDADRHHPYLGGCNSSSSFPDDLYTIHCEEAAELEWLSQFVEDSFSVDIPYPTPATTGAAHLRQAEPPSSTGKGARSKRSRPHVWSSLAAPPLQSYSTASSSSSSSYSTSELSHSPKPKAGGGRRRNTGARELAAGEEGAPRRCTHCASEKTPQWRLGPQGPKTLCNACGVRYKSGRLVPEYRPAASPTFVLTQHSNSHRKVMELRHKNEMLLPRHDARNSSSSRFMDYEVY